MVLEAYAREKRFPNPCFFVDDGYSGTNYDRPGFQEMLAKIEAGNVSTCITKDLSRLGEELGIDRIVYQLHFSEIRRAVYRYKRPF